MSPPRSRRGPGPRPEVLVLALALAFPGGLSAAGLRIERLTFIPANFGAGEAVEALALLEAEGREPEPFSLEVGAGLPEPPRGADPEILAIRLSRVAQGWELRVRFRPWSPGPGRIPSRSVEGSLLPALRYETASVRSLRDRDPAPPKPQLELPGTSLYLYGFAGLFLLLCLFAVALLLWILPGARALLERWRRAGAYRALNRSLAYLEAGLDQARPEAFYAALARSFRLYAAARFLPEIPALTPRELAALPEGRFPAEGLREEAAALLAETDDVRFGGEEPGRPAMAAALKAAARIARTAEEALG